MATKKTTQHPYAAIEHRVIDSPAYAALSFSAQALLVILVRQLTKDNNGHLQASFKYCQLHGFGSEHTLKKAIAELIAHGFIYRTLSHGANGAWARYAVTWLSITKKDGLFLASFKPYAWREWKPTDKQPAEKKAPRKKCKIDPAENAVSPPDFQQIVQEAGGQKVQTMN